MSDKGSEFSVMVIRKWLNRLGAKMLFIDAKWTQPHPSRIPAG